jgi:hypothetical protein
MQNLEKNNILQIILAQKLLKSYDFAARSFVNFDAGSLRANFEIF